MNVLLSVAPSPKPSSQRHSMSFALLRDTLPYKVVRTKLQQLCTVSKKNYGVCPECVALLCEDLRHYSLVTTKNAERYLYNQVALKAKISAHSQYTFFFFLTFQIRF